MDRQIDGKRKEIGARERMESRTWKSKGKRVVGVSGYILPFKQESSKGRGGGNGGKYTCTGLHS